MFRSRLEGRRILVVLDNAANETQVRPLIPANPRCAVLLTSRARLSALDGSSHVPLSVMSDEQGCEMFRRIVGTHRVEAESATAQEIVELCGGLPLAIRIAGAKVASRPSLPLDWFADRLRNERRRLDLLRVGDLAVRASFALSYDARSPSEQRAFRMLGLLKSPDFPSWNLGALMATDLIDAEDTVEALVDSELIELVGRTIDGQPRYRFHDLLRDFARELLAEVEPEEVRTAALRRLADRYVELASVAFALLHAKDPDHRVEPTDPSSRALVGHDGRGWLVLESASMVALARQTHDSGLDEQTLRIVEPLPIVFDWLSDWQNWEDTHLRALAAARTLGDRHGEGRILSNLGLLHRELGRFGEAIDHLEMATRLFQDVADIHREAIAQLRLGDAYRYNGMLEDAEFCFGASLKVFEEISDRRACAQALNGIADVSRGRSRWQDSRTTFDRCLATYRELGDPIEEARVQVRLAMVHRDQWRNDDALSLLDRSLGVFRALRDRRWEARTLRQIGVTQRNDGLLDHALEALVGCAAIFEEVGDQRGVAVTLRNLGDTHRQLGREREAASSLGRAMRMFEDMQDRRWSARTRLSLADLLRRQQRWAEAEEELSAVLAGFRETQDLHAEGRALRQEGLLLRDQGRWKDSGDRLEGSGDIFRILGDGLWEARAQMGMATLLGAMGRDASRTLHIVSRICAAAGVPENRVEQCLAEW